MFLIGSESRMPFALGAQALQDNSFRLEETYNHEAGIVRHINTFTRHRESRDWGHTLTQEWPVPDIRNQLSFTLPYQHLGASLDGRKGMGVVLLNHRYQWIGDGDAKLAVSPRFSVGLPMGARSGFGERERWGSSFGHPLWKAK